MLVASSVIASVLGAFAATASGATYNVGTTADSAGTCSPAPAVCPTLRDAIDTINTSPNPPDVINVPAGRYVLSLGALTITQNMTINGAGDGTGAGATSIDGNSVFQVFTVSHVGVSSLTLSGMNVVGGSDNSSTYGGGIHFDSTVTASLNISNAAFESGSSTGGAGAIYFVDGTDPGELNISNSTISGNTGNDGVAGGIDAEENGVGTLTIANSTISGNRAPNDDGGGIYSDSASVTITNSTISGNSANEGAGIYLSSGATTLTNDTIANNQNTPAGVDTGAGIYGVVDGNVTAINTIVSGNTGAKPASTDDCDVPVAAGHSDHSLEDGTGCGFDIPSANPDLQPMGSNGGPTETMALAEGSPAIDDGDGARCPATDQRGYPRPDLTGTACDIGAYETQSPTVSITTPANGAIYNEGQVEDASYACTPAMARP